MSLLVVPDILYGDVYEPETIINGCRQVVTTVQAPLNQEGYADYMWLNLEQKVVMWERKQLGEALSDLAGLEEQLHRHLGNCDELTLIVEGVGVPTEQGARMCKESMGGGWTLRGGFEFKRQPGLWARWERFRWSLWHECGVQVVQTFNWRQTVWALCAAFKACQVEEHKTLRRYTVPHVPQFSKNRHVDNLLRLKGIKTGPAKAELLIQKFDTLRKLMKATRPDLIAVMGMTWTDNFLKVIGRD